LAYELARLSLGPLRAALVDGGGGAITAQGWTLVPPSINDLPPQAGWGLPLIAACSPESETNALDHVAHLVDGLDNRELRPYHDAFRVRLAEAISIELRLWIVAAEHAEWSPRIPYAFQFLALEWLWSPQAHARDLLAPAVCLRCGTMWFPYRPIRSPPLCEHCRDESAKVRAWPAHAIAPDLRGQWWLRCQAEGCEAAFVGRRNRLGCDEHDSSRLTASKRQPVRGKPRSRR
jgi:hypothetical protein